MYCLQAYLLGEVLLSCALPRVLLRPEGHECAHQSRREEPFGQRVQSKFARCLKELLTPASYSRRLGYLQKPNGLLHPMVGQYLDNEKLRFLALSPEVRKQQLNKAAKRLGRDYP